MKTRLNNILIGLLWLLVATLGASFWFNTKYGFNVLSAQHWQYLAYMQASNQPVKPSFYISLVVVICVMVAGLYVLIHQHKRKIVLPVIDTNKHAKTPRQHPQESLVDELAQTQNKKTYTGNNLVRPPRLNIPKVVRTPMSNVQQANSLSVTQSSPSQENDKIRDIFTSAGFLFKGAPRIKNVQTSVIAIGKDEVLWIGATGVTISDMQNAVDTLNGVFLDTLEDIEIHINAFVLGAQDSDKNDASNIMQFQDIDELRKYISEHSNTPNDEDTEDFDAYSAYIGTVIDYIGKI